MRRLKFYDLDAEAVLKETDSDPEGLSSAEAEKRLAAHGKNKLAEAKKDSLVKRFFAQMADPMIIILLVAAAISAVLSVAQNESFADVIIILAVVIINAVLGVYQENKAEKAIEALQEMSAATSRVLRDGHIVSVKSEDLVPGDVVLLEAGDAVPADGRLLESASLKIEEAALTGESVPVSKFIDIIELRDGKDVPLGDRKNMAYMGSTVVYGRGEMVVTATGMDTEMGKIADALANASEGQTPLQRKLAQLSRVLTWLVIGICVVIFGVQLLRAGGFSFEVLLHSFMVAVSLAVAAIPEGLVAVVTIVLSIGVTNMSRRNAIIRRLTAVETLGCAQIICSDKTGTLTQNKMTVVDHFGADAALTATAMALCSDAELDADGSVTGEPTEAALVAWAASLDLKKDALKASTSRCGEAPFDSGRKRMSTVHALPDGGFVQYSKGGPDVILGLCTHVWEDGHAVPMTEEKRAEILAANKAMADRALRVLAAAKRDWPERPEDFEPETLEKDLCFLGLAGMIDPVRPEVKDAIVQCRSAGIRPIMITGDHIDTAVAIAKELGILQEGMRAVTGAELDAMDDEAFEKVFRDISVYARVQPEHKTRIVNAWRGADCVTAMTGDGVNDAPSIKSADIGIGMGITGTDVTKNVADMVLADDNFATIVSAVEEGRRIYANIRKAIQLLLSSNLSEVLSIFFATLMGFSLLQPAQLLWVNLITDSLPALALGLEKAEKDSMSRPPRDANAGIFSEGVGLNIVIQSVLVSAITLVAFFIGRHAETGLWGFGDSAMGMTMAFLALSLTETFHAFNMRSLRGSIFTMDNQNWYLWGAMAVSILLTLAAIYVPFLRDAFGFAYIAPKLFGQGALLSVSIIPAVEIIKWVERRTMKS